MNVESVLVGLMRGNEIDAKERIHEEPSSEEGPLPTIIWCKHLIKCCTKPLKLLEFLLNRKFQMNLGRG